MNDALIVVPARGGSVGIPRKAVRLLGDRPPLQRTLEMLEHLTDVDVAVVTDDDTIARIAVRCGVQVIPEPRLVTKPGEHTWEPVAAHVVQAMEQYRGRAYTSLAVVQCTSPFLEAATVRRCLNLLPEYGAAITVTDDRHARLGTPRMPRQQMPPCWKVTGGCTAIRRDLMRPDRWVMPDSRPVVVEGAEALDLDSLADWALAEWYCGATARETLMAKVLSEPPQWRGVVAQLSAWSESPEEGDYRREMPVVGGRIVRIRGAHTYHEAQLAMQCLRTGDDEITIVTSAYHQVRAFLTFLRVLQQQRRAQDIRLWNAPAPSRMDKLASEWDKIRTYHERGHVASYDEGLEYLVWRDSCVNVTP